MLRNAEDAVFVMVEVRGAVVLEREKLALIAGVIIVHWYIFISLELFIYLAFANHCFFVLLFLRMLPNRRHCECGRDCEDEDEEKARGFTVWADFRNLKYIKAKRISR